MLIFDLSAPSSPPPKSTFVTTVALAAIFLSTFSTFISIFQNIVVNLFFDSLQTIQIFQYPETVPSMFGFIMMHMRQIMGVFLFLSISALASGVGLLLRKEWARKLFLCVLSVGIMWNLFGLFLVYGIFESIGNVLSLEMEAQVASIFSTIKTLATVLILGLSCLLGWVMKKLMSREIRGEFINVKPDSEFIY